MATTSPIPLYHRVYTVLRQRILDGTYSPGTRLGTEDQLAGEFGVGRATIRQAVGHLVRESMLSRQQGRGTFVLQAPYDTLGHAFRGSLADLVLAGEVHRTMLREVTVDHDVPLPPGAARLLRLDPPRGTVVLRTRFSGDRPFAYTLDYLRPEHGALLTSRELRKHGLMQLLQDKGLTIESAHQVIRSQLADTQVSEGLHVPLGSAVLFVERLVTGRNDRPIEVFRSWYPSEIYEYSVTFS